MTNSEHSLREFPYITGVSSHLTGEIRWSCPVWGHMGLSLRDQILMMIISDEKKTSPVIINGLLILVAGSPGEKKERKII